MRRIVTGLAATLLLALLLIGMPVILIAAGPIGLPHIEPTLNGLWQALSRPDDGTLLLTLIKAAGWASWAVIAFTLLAELIARLRRVKVPTLPGLAIPQGAARALVATSLALFINVQGALAQPSDASHQEIAAAQVVPERGATAGDRATQRQQYTVKKGDILSQLALDRLGDATRYPEIFRASTGIRQPGGVHLTDPDVIDIGWKLNIPDRHPHHRHDERPEPSQPSAHDPTPVETPPATRPSRAPTDPAPSMPAPAAPTQAAPTQPAPAQAQAAPTEGSADDASGPQGGLLTGLVGAGALLAGSLWLVLRQRRALQHHHRRPGFLTSPSPAATLPVERTLRHEGQPISDLLVFVDETLRRLAAARLRDAQPLPSLVAIEVTRTSLTVHLAEATDLAEPWQAGESTTAWSVTSADDPDAIGPLNPDGPATWPHLATVGTDSTGHWWLLNFEHLGVATITGDPEFAEDLARYLAAELATNPWSRDLQINLVGVFEELTALNSVRLRHHPGPTGIDTTVAAAVDLLDRLRATGSPDAVTARTRQDGDDLWPSRALITQAAIGSLPQLQDLVHTMPGRTGTAVILLGDQTDDRTVEFQTSSAGKLHIPMLGLELTVTGITVDEALGAAQILQAAESVANVPVPAHPNGGSPWQDLCDQTGRLHDDLTLPRAGTDPSAGTSVLPGPDTDILQIATTTSDDLALLAPTVPPATAAKVATADPTLDTDFGDWNSRDTDRPRIAVLGTLKVRSGGRGDAVGANKRRPYFSEILAYLASRPAGVTNDELRAAFNINSDDVRRHLAVVRQWLGQDAHGSQYVPDAIHSPATRTRGTNAYQVQNVLHDADLFRRLRLRGQTRGPDGLADFMAALSLVTGAPYSGFRPSGGIWLAEHREDQIMVAAIVDTAHLAATMALASGDADTAERAIQTALMVAPDEDTSKLDLAAVASFRVGQSAGQASANSVMAQRDLDGPLELDSRTVDLLVSHGWVAPNSRAG
jgi:hypothetical protein